MIYKGYYYLNFDKERAFRENIYCTGFEVKEIFETK